MFFSGRGGRLRFTSSRGADPLHKYHGIFLINAASFFINTISLTNTTSPFHAYHAVSLLSTTIPRGLFLLYSLNLPLSRIPCRLFYKYNPPLPWSLFNKYNLPLSRIPCSLFYKYSLPLSRTSCSLFNECNLPISHISCCLFNKYSL